MIPQLQDRDPTGRPDDALDRGLRVHAKMRIPLVVPSTIVATHAPTDMKRLAANFQDIRVVSI